MRRACGTKRQAKPVSGRSAGEAADALGNGPWTNRAPRASPARTPCGLQGNCPSPAAVTPRAFVIISLAVTQFILSRADDPHLSFALPGLPGAPGLR
jgi:hypothetical protein